MRLYFLCAYKVDNRQDHTLRLKPCSLVAGGANLQLVNLFNHTYCVVLLCCGWDVCKIIQLFGNMEVKGKFIGIFKQNFGEVVNRSQ